MLHIYVTICFLLLMLFFFFKQKTAYELRISDWSSDVCSSDLIAPSIAAVKTIRPCSCRRAKAPRQAGASGEKLAPVIVTNRPPSARRASAEATRSEEHTSELQSLMRISYAGFCLKKKKS